MVMVMVNGNCDGDGDGDGDGDSDGDGGGSSCTARHFLPRHKHHQLTGEVLRFISEDCTPGALSVPHKA